MLNQEEHLHPHEYDLVLENLFERMQRLIRPNTRVRIIAISFDPLNPFRTRSSQYMDPILFTYENMYNILHFQYYAGNFDDIQFVLEVVDIDVGGRGKALNIPDPEISRSIRQILDDHNLARAIVVGLSYKNITMLQQLFGATQQPKTIQDNRKSCQLELAKRLETLCEIIQSCTLIDRIRKIESRLQIKIVIYLYNKRIYYQNDTDYSTVLFYLYDEKLNHLDYLTKLTEVFKTDIILKCNLC